jgi:hypothetical protein
MFRNNISPPSSGLKSKLSEKPAEADGKLGSNRILLLLLLLCLIFDSKDGGDKISLKIRLSKKYEALKHRKLCYL